MATDAAATGPRETPGLGGALRRAARGIRWYVETLMGDRAYATYVAHLAVAHPGVEPPTERAFWRERMADQDRNPGSRCC